MLLFGPHIVKSMDFPSWSHVFFNYLVHKMLKAYGTTKYMPDCRSKSKIGLASVTSCSCYNDKKTASVV